mgnify:CR=1 FL=1
MDVAYQDKVLGCLSSLMSQNTSPYTPFQKLAWQRLEQKGLPQKNQEAFQYVSLRKLYESFLEPKKPALITKQDISSLLLPECQSSYIVFQDGVFCPDLSSIPSSFVVFSLEDALKSSYAVFLKHRLQASIEKEEDPWALVNAALCMQGVFIYVPPKVQETAPIQVLHLQSDPSISYAGPRMHLCLGAHASICMVSSFSSYEGSSTVYNDFLDVSLEESSSFSHVFTTEKPCFSWGLSAFRASLKKESKLHSYFATFGSPGFRRDYSVALLGERAEAHLNGLTALDARAESHIHVHMDHSAPSCQSRQFFKNILAEQSRSSFTGKIYVRRPAQKTEAYQLNQNLLLSDLATANTKPNLEIFADDVKASHGATVAQIDEDQLFYLRARGIPCLAAKGLLTMGFCQEILESIPVLSLRNTLSLWCRSFLLEQRENDATSS